MAERMLITGGGGFLGTHMCQYFGERGHSIAAVGRFQAPLELSEYYPNLWRLCGMTLPDPAFEMLVQEFQPTALIHCAGTSSVPESVREPFADFRNTVDVCAFVLETIRKYAPDCRVYLISSASVYGNPAAMPIPESASCLPISPYGYHKYLCELLVEEYQKLHGLSTAILRVFSAYGEYLQKQVIFDLCRKFSSLASDQVEVFGTGDESRDFIYAADVAQAVACIHQAGETGVFNVASGIATPIREVVTLVRTALASPKVVSYSGAARPGDPLYWQADISKLGRLGFAPRTPLSDGIGQYCTWYQRKGIQ